MEKYILAGAITTTLIGVIVFLSRDNAPQKQEKEKPREK